MPAVVLRVLYGDGRGEILAKIAEELQQALARRAVSGEAGRAAARVLARGAGWTVSDVMCTSGPRDRPFEERHGSFSIAIVAAGTFQYRSAAGSVLMTPGSVLLGSAGQCFECGHEHGSGDRCFSFGYAPEYFEKLAADAGISGAGLDFRVNRLPPLRALSPLVARVCAAMDHAANAPWEELGVKLAATVAGMTAGLPVGSGKTPPGATARVAKVVRRMEREAGTPLGLAGMAREARLSPYHFLRTFQALTGVTPHQYILRDRLRRAALRLAEDGAARPAKILDIALDCGFGDVSNFNRAFRAEFGMCPRAYRLRTRGRE